MNEISSNEIINFYEVLERDIINLLVAECNQVF
jgi:hypothetical protein